MARDWIGVAGASGYAGGELVRLLLTHPHVGAAKLRLYSRKENAGERLSAMHPGLAGNFGAETDLVTEPMDFARCAADGLRLIFFATPHEQSRVWVPEALAHGIRVVDLSGAWRLRQAANRAAYSFEDEGTALAEQIQDVAIYGSPELHADCIQKARLVANPGCYATSVILALAPLVRSGVVDVEHGIIADAKSGVSGAGKAATAKTHFMYAADNFSAYGVFGHRHTGELVEQLGIPAESVTFTPHLLPVPRGILSTVYVSLRETMGEEEIDQIFSNFYADAPMVRFRGRQLPQLAWTARANFCDLGYALAGDGRRLIVVSCLDNLLKGAASQAVENMNLMLGFKGSEGLL